MKKAFLIGLLLGINISAFSIDFRVFYYRGIRITDNQQPRRKQRGMLFLKSICIRCLILFSRPKGRGIKPLNTNKLYYYAFDDEAENEEYDITWEKENNLEYITFTA